VKRRALVIGLVAVLGISVATLASTSPSGAKVVKGTGTFGCHLDGTVTFSPPFKSGATGKVTASVDLSGPAPNTGGCSTSTTGANPLPTSVQVTGELTFQNGNCSAAHQAFTSKHTLTVTYVPVVHSSKFSFTTGRSGVGISGTGYFGGAGAVKGSYPVPAADSPGLAETPATLTGSCSGTGITEMSWSGSHNPPNYEALVGF
jgi:hypothetical protein